MVASRPPALFPLVGYIDAQVTDASQPKWKYLAYYRSFNNMPRQCLSLQTTHHFPFLKNIFPTPFSWNRTAFITSIWNLLFRMLRRMRTSSSKIKVLLTLSPVRSIPQSLLKFHKISHFPRRPLLLLQFRSGQLKSSLLQSSLLRARRLSPPISYLLSLRRPRRLPRLSQPVLESLLQLLATSAGMWAPGSRATGVRSIGRSRQVT